MALVAIAVSLDGRPIEAGSGPLDPIGDLQRSADPANAIVRAVLDSLLSDRRAGPGDEVDGADRPGAARGSWWDGLDGTIDRWGSRLWLLERAVAVAETVARAEALAVEALDWLVADGVASRVDVLGSILAPGRIALRVDVVRPEAAAGDRDRWADLWEALPDADP